MNTVIETTSVNLSFAVDTAREMAELFNSHIAIAHRELKNVAKLRIAGLNDASDLNNIEAYWNVQIVKYTDLRNQFLEAIS